MNLHYVDRNWVESLSYLLSNTWFRLSINQCSVGCNCSVIIQSSNLLSRSTTGPQPYKRDHFGNDPIVTDVTKQILQDQQRWDLSRLLLVDDAALRTTTNQHTINSLKISLCFI